MGSKSKIQWTDTSWNPWHGCKKVSHGCKYCYMYRDKDRYGQDPTTVMKSKTKFAAPLNWDDPRKIFTCSWSDWFIEDADGWREEAWDIIKATPHHTYQILTKRPERIKQHLPDDWGDGYDNVWLGVSVENQDAADKRVPQILQIPASVRFLSCEPLLGKINFRWEPYAHQAKNQSYRQYLNQNGSINQLESLKGIDWIIAGGESGNETGKYRYRKCEASWFRKIIEDAQKADVPVFVKQLGSHLAKAMNLNDRFGGDISEWPEWLQIREFPEEVLT